MYVFGYKCQEIKGGKMGGRSGGFFFIISAHFKVDFITFPKLNLSRKRESFSDGVIKINLNYLAYNLLGVLIT